MLKLKFELSGQSSSIKKKKAASLIDNDSNFVITTKRSLEFQSAAINLHREEEPMRRSPASQYMQSPRRPKTEVP